jgi:hypothetical protein
MTNEILCCRVTDNYSASEAIGMTFECRRRQLHVNADWYILEPVDEAYEPVPPGQPSHSVLVTNLANRVQPIIRYELGDSITVSPARCPCGSPLPAIRVEGRTDEILSFLTPRLPLPTLRQAQGSALGEGDGRRPARLLGGGVGGGPRRQLTELIFQSS